MKRESIIPKEPREEKNRISPEEMLTLLPHRYPMLLVDYIDDFETGKWSIGVKSVTANEPFFQGHFPGYPIMPGVLILESMAQSAVAIFAKMPGFKGKTGLFGGIRNARFRSQVRPGDKLMMYSELIKMKGPLLVIYAEAKVEGTLVCNAEMGFMYAEIDSIK